MCAGGSVSWAWTADKFGWQWWVDLSKAVGNWTNASVLEPLDELAWTAPVDASMRSFPAQFVAAVLALGTNVERPSIALMSDAAYNDECIYLTRSDIDEEILSDAHLLSRCVLYHSSVRSKEQAEASSAPRHWVQGEKELECDLLGGSFLSSYVLRGRRHGDARPSAAGIRLVRRRLLDAPAALEGNQRNAALRPADLRRRQAAVLQRHRRRRVDALLMRRDVRLWRPHERLALDRPELGLHFCMPRKGQQGCG